MSDDHPLVRSAEAVLRRMQELDATRESVLSTDEERRIIEGMLSLKESRLLRRLTDEEVDALVPEIIKVLNWSVQARLSQTTIDLALGGLISLEWDWSVSDVRPSLTARGMEAMLGG